MMALCTYDFHEGIELDFQLCLPLSNKTVRSLAHFGTVIVSCNTVRPMYFFVVAMTTMLLGQT